MVSAWNIIGALQASVATGLNAARVEDLCADLDKNDVILAVVGEPRLGPGVNWPDELGYEYVGERSAEPDTVGVLVKTAARHAVQVVRTSSQGRVVWLYAPDGRQTARPTTGGKRMRTTAAGSGWLIAAVYAPTPGSFTDAERVQFWEDVARDGRELLAQPAYSGAHVALVIETTGVVTLDG